MGVILTMTMMMMTGLAITRERERGTMENLLAMPARPLEVMIGKIVPYIVDRATSRSTIILHRRAASSSACRSWAASRCSSRSLLSSSRQLAVGIAFRRSRKNQLQAMQLTFFYFLPSILLSGFMFPFRGMPEWAQGIGRSCPLTHFNRIVRGILLKGNDLADLWPSLWPLMVFALVVMTIAVRFYRRTLD